jgi:hypothetical protein
VRRDNELEVIEYWRQRNRADRAEGIEEDIYIPPTHEEYLEGANRCMLIALENEEIFGLEDLRTIEAYESARVNFVGALTSTGLTEDLRDIQELTPHLLTEYAGCLVKLSNSSILEGYKSPESQTVDRNENLFEAALSAYDHALSLVEHKAPEDEWVPIIVMRADAYATHAVYQKESGLRREASENYAEALRTVNLTMDRITSEHSLAQLNQERSEIVEEQTGHQTEEYRLADKILLKLVRG